MSAWRAVRGRLLLASLASAWAACASPAPSVVARGDDALAARLEAVRSRHGVPGMGVAILRGARTAISPAG